LQYLKKKLIVFWHLKKVPKCQTPWKSVQWSCAMRSGTHDAANSLFFEILRRRLKTLEFSQL
jgi:hypothetical protein